MVRVESGRHEATAPSEPEWRPGPAPAIERTAEQLAQDLAQDPEFRAWRGAEFLADLSAKTREAHR